MRHLTMTALAAIALAYSATSAGAQIQDRIIRFGHLNNVDHPVSAGVKKFTELVAAKSGGKMVVKEFPSNQLGSEQQQTSALQGGVQEMQSPATTSVATILPELGLIDFPFLMGNHAQAFALLDGPLGDALREKLKNSGLIALCFWDLGFRNVTNSKRPITKVEDLSGLKLRVIPNPVFIETFKAFGANPVPMAWPEVYTALETKAIDGHENAWTVIVSNKIYEVQKYVSGTNHVYGTNIILMSKKFWDRLSAEEQKIIQDSANEARTYQRQVSKAAADAAADELRKHGMQVNMVSDEERARMQAIAKPITDKFLASYDPAIQALYRSESERIKSLK